MTGKRIHLPWPTPYYPIEEDVIFGQYYFLDFNLDLMLSLHVPNSAKIVPRLFFLLC